MVPLAKSGGLGDVCGALPGQLQRIGCPTTCFLPAYRTALQSGLPIQPTSIAFTIPIGNKVMACRLLETRLPRGDVLVYLIDQPHYFDRPGLYLDQHGEYRDNCERFCFFCRAVVEAIQRLELPVDIVHCHDWQTGLIPALISAHYNGLSWMRSARTVMTIHNLAYQGQFWHYDMPLTGLGWEHFHWQRMEFHGHLNLLKTGIVYADKITTVSPTYAREITTPEHGCGLDPILRQREADLVGIVNGVDYEQWNPETDPHLPVPYGPQRWREGKAQCKVALQQELGLRVDAAVPLIGIVSRLVDQKGWDLILPLLRQWVQHREVQWAILGTGEQRYEQPLRELADEHPQLLAARLEFSEALAHRIEAGSDMFLMPSRYEPCGLNQLYSLKYGTVPIVNPTGGLADTVVDATPDAIAEHRATGFYLPSYSLEGLEQALRRAVDVYQRQPPTWGRIVEQGMLQDWSWHRSAEHYRQVYLSALALGRETPALTEASDAYDR